VLPLRLPIFLVVACLQLGSGCTQSREPSATACEERLRRLSARLALVRNQPVDIRDATLAPPSEVQRPLDDLGPVLQLVDGRTELDGRRISDTIGGVEATSWLKTDLDTLRRNWGILHPGQPQSEIGLYVLASPGLEVSRLLAAITDLEPPFQARLLVRTPGWSRLNPLPTNARPELRTRVAAIEAATGPTAPLIRDLASASRANCPALDDVFNDLHEMKVTKMDDALIDGAPAAIASCGCSQVDIDAVEAAIILVLMPKGPPLGWLPINIGNRSKPDAELLELRPAATVADLVSLLGRVEAAGKSVYLAEPSTRSVLP
jgi:hypothetical protein